jgi:hypothetical protein
MTLILTGRVEVVAGGGRMKESAGVPGGTLNAGVVAAENAGAGMNRGTRNWARIELVLK